MNGRAKAVALTAVVAIVVVAAVVGHAILERRAGSKSWPPPQRQAPRGRVIGIGGRPVEGVKILCTGNGLHHHVLGNSSRLNILDYRIAAAHTHTGRDGRFRFRRVSTLLNRLKSIPLIGVVAAERNSRPDVAGSNILGSATLPVVIAASDDGIGRADADELAAGTDIRMLAWATLEGAICEGDALAPGAWVKLSGSDIDGSWSGLMPDAECSVRRRCGPEGAVLISHIPPGPAVLTVTDPEPGDAPYARERPNETDLALWLEPGRTAKVEFGCGRRLRGHVIVPPEWGENGFAASLSLVLLDPDGYAPRVIADPGTPSFWRDDGTQVWRRYALTTLSPVLADGFFDTHHLPPGLYRVYNFVIGSPAGACYFPGEGVLGGSAGRPSGVIRVTEGAEPLDLGALTLSPELVREVREYIDNLTQRSHSGGDLVLLPSMPVWQNSAPVTQEPQGVTSND